MNKLYILSAIVLAMTFVSCDNEETLTPSNADNITFCPKEGATDEESVLRNNFFNTSGSYLLFTDTLNNGELLNIGYVMTASENNDTYVYDYLSDIEEKKSAVNFIEKYLLPHLGKQLRPFSFLLVKNITHYTNSGKGYYQNYDETDNPAFVTGVRATAIAMEATSSMDDEELQNYTQDIIKGILTKIIPNQTTSTYKKFYAYGDKYYNDFMGIWPSEEEYMSLMNEKGFICGHYSYGWLITDAYPSVEEDVAAYIGLVMNSTAEEVEKQYSNYPDISTKYQLMAKLMKELGYVE